MQKISPFLAAIIILIFLSWLLTGCASYRGLIPDKDVSIQKLTTKTVTPFGSHEITLEGVETKVAK